MSPHRRVVGIDLGASAVHAVALGLEPTVRGGPLAVLSAEVFDAEALDAITRFCAQAAFVAVDAPDMLSSAPHADDPDVPKGFGNARCCEIALARNHRMRVSWPTPTADAATWMQAGFAVWAALREDGHAPMEVWPHACFLALAGRMKPKKTPEGLRQRRDALTAHVEDVGISMWSHDGLDALVAALTAALRMSGQAVSVTCGHDRSEIWLPNLGA